MANRLFQLLRGLFYILWCPILAMAMMLGVSPLILYIIDRYPEWWDLMFSIPFLFLYLAWLIVFLTIVFLLRMGAGKPIRKEIGLIPYGRSLTVWYILLAITSGFVLGGSVVVLQEYDLYPKDLGVEWYFRLMVNSFYGIIVLALLGPLVEEIIFRGVVLKRLIPMKGPVWALLVSSALFSVWHMNWYQIPYTFLMGVILGLVFIWSRSLWASILIHVINNTLSMFPHATDDPFLVLPLWCQIAILAILLVASLWILRRLKRRSVSDETEETKGDGEEIPSGAVSIPEVLFGDRENPSI